MKNKIHRLVCFIILAIGLLSSCYQPNEACLDRFASNYDVTTDDACESCCTYPNLVLQFSHKRDSITVTAGDTLQDDFQHSFVLEQLEYFVSDVVLIDNVLREIRVQDTVELELDTGLQVYTDDFQHISLSQTSYTIGQMITESDMQSIQFTIGIIPKNIALDELDEDFVLNEFKDSLYTVGGFLPWQCALRRDTSDLSSTEVSGIAGETYSIELIKEIDVKIGENISIPINVNLDSLFYGIDIEVISEGELVSKLTNNLSKTFN